MAHQELYKREIISAKSSSALELISVGKFTFNILTFEDRGFRISTRLSWLFISMIVFISGSLTWENLKKMVTFQKSNELLTDILLDPSASVFSENMLSQMILV